MKRAPLPCLIFILLAMPHASSTPAAAERAKMAYQLGVERWVLETRIAATPEEREAAAANRPDPGAAAREVWRAIAADLHQPWTLPYTAWFIQMADGLGAMDAGDDPNAAGLGENLTRALDTISRHHLKSDGLAPVCMALAGRGSPDRLALLEKIRSGHPDKVVRGVAALAESLALKPLGDEPAVIAKRLGLLREAIINSADYKLHETTTVGDVASEELYVITNLTKGRTAPDLVGRDTAGRAIKLSDHAGKVVILMFWSANDPNEREFIEFAAAMHARLRGKPIEIIGVNIDATAVLRPMEADGRVTWRNFSDPEGLLAREYRTGFTPLCFVLDGKRVIQHVGPPGAFVELAAVASIEGNDD